MLLCVVMVCIQSTGNKVHCKVNINLTIHIFFVYLPVHFQVTKYFKGEVEGTKKLDWENSMRRARVDRIKERFNKGEVDPLVVLLSHYHDRFLRNYNKEKDHYPTFAHEVCSLLCIMSRGVGFPLPAG